MLKKILPKNSEEWISLDSELGEFLRNHAVFSHICDSSISTSQAADLLTFKIQEFLLQKYGSQLSTAEKNPKVSPKTNFNRRESEALKKARKARNLARKARSKAVKNKDRQAARKHHLECLKLHNRIKARERKIQEQDKMKSSSKTFFQDPWKYCKDILNGVKEAVLPAFSLQVAKDYFSELYSDNDS